MYLFIEILLIVLCLGGILYFVRMGNKYKNDVSGSKDTIVNYFKEKKAFNEETGIKVKDLPINIAKNPFLIMMVKDKTLMFKKGKYYLNK